MIGGIENDAAIRAVLQPGEAVLWHSHPGAGRLFLSVVPSLLRNFIFLALVVFGIYTGWQETDTWSRVGCVAIVLFLIYWSVVALREGTAARVSHYLVTDRRIILLTPRAALKQFIILPHSPKDGTRHSANWIDDLPSPISAAAKRATIRIGYRAWMTISLKNPVKSYRSRSIRMYAVTEPQRAIAMIAQIRRSS